MCFVTSVLVHVGGRQCGLEFVEAEKRRLVEFDDAVEVQGAQVDVRVDPEPCPFGEASSPGRNAGS